MTRAARCAHYGETILTEKEQFTQLVYHYLPNGGSYENRKDSRCKPCGQA
jgi:hypothetical protein